MTEAAPAGSLPDTATSDPQAADRTAALSLAELKRTRRLVCTVDGVDVLVLMTAAGVVAMKNACTHLNMPLDQGRLIAGQIHCPYHGACFDLKTGRAMSGPAVFPLKLYAATVDCDDIYLSPAG